ncbi:hypothetical protein ACHAP1_005861 [Verticillium nonalfalfae]
MDMNTIKRVIHTEPCSRHHRASCYAQDVSNGPPGQLASLCYSCRYSSQSGNISAAMVSIAVQPPTETQTCRPIYPPVVAQTHVRAGGRHNNTHLFATAALLDDQGRVLDGQLGGALVATGYAVEDRGSGSRQQSVAFAFPDLALTYAGVYSIRVDVYRVNYDDGDTDNATMIEQAETELFYGFSEAVAVQRPNKPNSCRQPRRASYLMENAAVPIVS